jgi:hypothetical protein
MQDIDLVPLYCFWIKSSIIEGEGEGENESEGGSEGENEGEGESEGGSEGESEVRVMARARWAFSPREDKKGKGPMPDAPVRLKFKHCTCSGKECQFRGSRYMLANQIESQILLVSPMNNK